MTFGHWPWIRRDFALPSFEPASLEFEELEERLSDPAADAGELRAPASGHTCAVGDTVPPIDAAAELRQALSEIRRSLD